MNRYVVLGITYYGRTTRLANRRGVTPDEAITQAFKKGNNLIGGYDQIILVAIGEDHGRVGDTLNVATYLVQEVPRPIYELTKIL